MIAVPIRSTYSDEIATVAGAGKERHLVIIFLALDVLVYGQKRLPRGKERHGREPVHRPVNFIN